MTVAGGLLVALGRSEDGCGFVRVVADRLDRVHQFVECDGRVVGDRRLLGRERLPLRLLLAELGGALAGPLFYAVSRRRARRLGEGRA